MKTDITSDETTEEGPVEDAETGQKRYGTDRLPEADRVTVVLQATYMQPDGAPTVCNIRASRLVRVEETPLARTYRVKPGQEVPVDWGGLNPEAVEVLVVNKTGFRAGRVPANAKQIEQMAKDGVLACLGRPGGAVVSVIRPGRGVWLDSPGGTLVLQAQAQEATLDVFLFPY